MRLQESGRKVALICGSGHYRKGERPQPNIPIIRLETKSGKRGSALSTLQEYRWVYNAFQGYIQEKVSEGDIVICTSAPPQTIYLASTILKKKAVPIYWLQDFYPCLLRGFIKYPIFVQNILKYIWSRELNRWRHVVKCSSNLDYVGENTSVIRNWHTVDLGEPRPYKPKTAYYFGNLGYGHSLDLFVKKCEELKGQGFTVCLIGDGPKASKLPPWIERKKAESEEHLIRLLWEAENHLVAADPEVTGAVFPSKYWNSRATGRTIVTSGFAGPMLRELDEVQALTHLPTPEPWVNLIQTL